MTARPQGPYVKKLAIRFMSVDAVPKDGGFGDAIAFLANPGRVIESARESVANAFAAIDAVKSASDNPYGNDDETIAKAIVEACEKRIKKRIEKGE